MLHYSINICEQKENTMKTKFKQFWKKFMCIAESFGRARAASALAREGNHKLAREIMLEKSECC